MNVNIIFVLCMTAFTITEANDAEPFIIGGGLAYLGEIPWMVSLSARQWGYKHYCGGSILDARTILTAAHCAKKYDAVNDKLKVRVGSLIRDTGGVQYDVTKIIVHPDYTNISGVYNSDVAILKLANDIPLNPLTAAKVQLPTGGELATGTKVKVAGWGIYKDNSTDLSAFLRVVQVPIIDQTVCNQSYGTITDLMFCAGAPGQDSCNHDSGGPVTKGNVIYGIVSWGIPPCGDPVIPGVYTDVVALRDWIIANKA